MTRTIFTFIFASIIAAFAYVLVEMPGNIVVEAETFEAEVSMGIGIALLLAVIVASYFGIRLLQFVFKSPRHVGQLITDRRHKKGQIALADGMLAVAAGDAGGAKKLAARANRLLKEEPLKLLLGAQAAQLEGDEATAEAYFAEMLSSQDTAFLGLRGLFVQAMRHDDIELAYSYAKQADQLRPGTSWVLTALFDIETRHNDWSAARLTLDRMAKAKQLSGDIVRRRRAVLMAAQARNLETEDPSRALKLANDAVKLVPGLIPAAVTASRLLAQSGRMWKAASIVETAWSQSPHPELAVIYERLKSDASSDARARRVMGLSEQNPLHEESQILIAAQQISLGNWGAARAAIAEAARHFPSARVCTLMAEIERGENGESFEAREWLSRAARAPRSAQWTCSSCRTPTAQWTALCTTCAAFDTLAWSSPVTDILEPETPSLDKQAALLPSDKEVSLPVLRAESPEPLHKVKDFFAKQRTRTQRLFKKSSNLPAVIPSVSKEVETTNAPNKTSAPEKQESVSEAHVVVQAPVSPPVPDAPLPVDEAKIGQTPAAPLGNTPNVDPALHAPDDPGPGGEVFDKPASRNDIPRV